MPLLQRARVCHFQNSTCNNHYRTCKVQPDPISESIDKLFRNQNKKKPFSSVQESETNDINGNYLDPRERVTRFKRRQSRISARFRQNGSRHLVALANTRTAPSQNSGGGWRLDAPQIRIVVDVDGSTAALQIKKHIVNLSCLMVIYPWPTHFYSYSAGTHSWWFFFLV